MQRRFLKAAMFSAVIFSPSCLAWWGRLITPAPVPHSAGAPPASHKPDPPFFCWLNEVEHWRSEWLASARQLPAASVVELKHQRQVGGVAVAFPAKAVSADDTAASG